MNTPYHNKALPQGTVLREWRLERVLGAGGFGIVYRGTGIYFGEDVAIKEYFPGAISDRLDGTTVAPTDSSSEEIYELGRKKFMEEAKVLWNLSRPERHPNIVSVRSLFEVHGTAYMVMDFESGLSLSEMLHRGQKFDEKSLLAIIRPIAQGLESAHKSGVLHRDIKPANILINQSGRPVLIDFGSARFESGQATNTKVTFYTPPYAAIEQYVKTFPQGPWTDIYALGVVLYQCVTGDKPPEVLERMHGGSDEPLAARNWPGYSPSFIRAVDAALAIRPVERPQSISEWLKLFEAGAQPVPDEATRIVSRLPPVAPKTPPTTATTPEKPKQAKAAGTTKKATPSPKQTAAPAPKQSVAAAPAQSAAAVPTRAQARRPTIKHVIGGSLAAAFLASLVFFIAWPRPSHKTETLAAGAPVNTVQPHDQAAPDLGGMLDMVIAAAQKLNRPQTEIASLTNSKTKILALAALKTPEGADQSDNAAREMGKFEISALARSARRAWRDLGSLPGVAGATDPGSPMGQLKAAKADLDTKLAADIDTLDAAAAIEAVRQTQDAFSAFQASSNAASPQIVATRQKDLTDLLTKVEASSEQIAALAKVSKPWFLASDARKQAYQLRQDNAARAQALLTTLRSAVSVAQSSKDLKVVNGAIAQLTAGEETLTGLYAASSGVKL